MTYSIIFLIANVLYNLQKKKFLSCIVFCRLGRLLVFSVVILCWFRSLNIPKKIRGFRFTHRQGLPLGIATDHLQSTLSLPPF